MTRDWKYYLGMGLLIYNVVPYGFVFLILPFLSVSKVSALSLATGLLVSAEIAFLLSVALLGKPFVQLLKSKIKGLIFRKKEDSPLRPVGRFRHRAGITMLLLASFVPYFLTEILLAMNFVEKHGHTALLFILVIGDLLFVASFFVLGGEFWGRVKSLLEWPENTGTGARNGPSA